MAVSMSGCCTADGTCILGRCLSHNEYTVFTFSVSGYSVRFHIDIDPVFLLDLLVGRGGKINIDRGPELEVLAEKEKKLDELIQTCLGQIHWMCEDHHSQRYPFFVNSFTNLCCCVLSITQNNFPPGAVLYLRSFLHIHHSPIHQSRHSSITKTYENIRQAYK